ncbi:MAG: c-type cytochrome [Arenicellales bacterium]
MLFNRLSLLLPALILVACGQGESEIFNAEAAVQKWNRPEKIWTEAKLKTLDEGEKRYRENCSACHPRDGKGNHQIGAPALHGSPLALGQKSDFI